MAGSAANGAYFLSRGGSFYLPDRRRKYVLAIDIRALTRQKISGGAQTLPRSSKLHVVARGHADAIEMFDARFPPAGRPRKFELTSLAAAAPFTLLLDGENCITHQYKNPSKYNLSG